MSLKSKQLFGKLMWAAKSGGLSLFSVFPGFSLFNLHLPAISPDSSVISYVAIE